MDVLHLDNHLFVVCKPPGMLAQADHTGDLDVLTWGKSFLREQFDKPGDVFLGLVHRLDRPASGVMVLARTSKAARRLSAQFRERLADKRYLAVVEGEAETWGTCIDYVKKEQHPGGGFSVTTTGPDDPDGKRAELTYQRLACEGGLSLLLVRLGTGRSHQIRVQLAARGWPLLGDSRYGARRVLDGRNIALHSYLLRVEHPTRREGMRFTAPPPALWEGRFAEAVHRLLEQP